MSTLAYSITEISREDYPLIETAFVKHFANGGGAVFGVFSVPRNTGTDALAHAIRERLAAFAARPAPAANLLEAAFERVVQSVNESCQHIIQNAEAPIDLSDLDLAIGATSGRLLVMTGIGGFRGTLLRSENAETYHVYDLLRGLGDEVPSTEKLFGSLIAGELEVSDTIGIALPETVATVEEATWKRLLATSSPGAARAYIDRALLANNRGGVALILRMTKGEPATHEAAEGGAMASITALERTEQTTDRLLRGGKSLWQTTLNKCAAMLRTLSDALRTLLKKRQRVRTTIPPAPITPSPSGERTPQRRNTTGSAGTLRAIARFFAGIGLAIVGALSALLHFFRHPIRSLRDERVRRHALRDVRDAGHRMGDLVITRFNALPRISKILFVGVLVFIVLFLQSVIYLRYRNAAQAERDAYAAEIARIERTRDEAEAMVIYRDEDAARGKLLEALAAAEALPNDSRSKRERRTALVTEIEQALVGLRHEVPATPTAVALLPADPPADAYNRWLYHYDDPNGENPIVAYTSAEGRAIALRRDGAVALAAEDGSLTPLLVSVPRGAIAAAALFGDRLYALAPSDSQIYRFNRSGPGYGGATAWLNEEQEELAVARGITIDGSIYVLTPTAVLKFFTGAKETDWHPYIDPPLTDATRIFTSEEAVSVYLLEPTTRRVVVLDKSGSLLAQYIFPEGSNLRDFAVDETDKKLSVLNGDRVEEIELTHLQ